MNPIACSGDLAHVATWRLPGGSRVPADVRDPVGLAVAAAVHRVTGVALAAVEDGAVAGSVDELRDVLFERHLDELRRDLLIEGELVAVVERLASAGVETRVLKGGATAHLDHSDPALRSVGDVDVLVGRSELGRATRALADLTDVDRTIPDRRASWTESYGKDRTLALVSGGAADVHRLVAPGFHGLVDRHDWFGGRVPFVVGGTRMFGLEQVDRFVHALAHAGYADELRVNSARDVLMLLASLDGDWRDAVEREPSWRGLLARGVTRVWGGLRLGDHPIRSWAGAVEPSARERVALRMLDLPGSRAHWGGIAATSPLRWPSLVGPLIRPSTAYADTHESRASRAVAALRGLARRPR